MTTRIRVQTVNWNSVSYRLNPGPTQSNNANRNTNNYKNKKKPDKVKKKRRDNEHLQIWLKTRQLLSDDFHYNPDTKNNATNKYDQKLLESNKQSIIESFGTFNDILNVFIENGNKQQLQKIYNILKDIRLNNPPISSNDKNINKDNKNHQQTESVAKKYCGFTHLSSVEICCITEYLSKDMMNKFKLCSRKIGIVCLQQMNKMTIGLYNMNKLIYHKQKDLFFLNTAKFMSYNRYTSNINHSIMFDLWSKYYNIPTERQLIFTFISSEKINFFTAKTFANYLSISESKISAIKRQSKYGKKLYLLFDTVNVIVLTQNDAINMFDYSKQNIIKDAANYKLLILKYFDVFAQSMNICSFLFIHKTVTFQRLFDYIQNKFIIHNNDQEWYTNFKHELHELNIFNSVEDNRKFNICQENQIAIFDETSKQTVVSKIKSHILVFQFNHNHSYIKQKVKEQQQRTLKKVYRNSKDFISDYKKIKISFIDNNTVLFGHVLSHLSNQQNLNVNVNNQSVDFRKDFTFSIGRTWTFGLLKKKIAAELNSILKIQTISHRNIDLFQKPKAKNCEPSYYSYNHRNVTDICRFKKVSDSNMVNYNLKNWTWNLVSYKSVGLTANECIYEINLYLSHPSVNAIQYEAKYVSHPIYVRYNKVFKVKDFVNYMHKHISDIYSNNSDLRSVLSLLFSNNNLLTEFECCYGMNDTFSNINGNLKVCHLNFYIMQHNGINKLHAINSNTLSIRFVTGYPSNVSKGTSYSVAVKELCGIPYLISFDTNSNLQSIINGNGFNQWVKENISHCYKLSNGRNSNIATVSRKSGSYEHINVYDTFMKDNANDILIIKLRKGLNEYP